MVIPPIKVVLKLHTLNVAGPEKDKSSKLLSKNFFKARGKAYWFIKRNDLQGTD